VSDDNIIQADEGDIDRLRALLRAMLGHAEPEPEQTGNVVPQEGRSAGRPGISADQYAADFIKRLTGEIPAFAQQLPEPEQG
jgi:hypothetical protein